MNLTLYSILVDDKPGYITYGHDLDHAQTNARKALKDMGLNPDKHRVEVEAAPNGIGIATFFGPMFIPGTMSEEEYAAQQ